MSFINRLFQSTAALLFLAAGSAASAGEIHRCVDADGHEVYTDRFCASMGIDDKLPDAIEAGFVPRELGYGCAARSPEAMRSAIHAAIAGRDTNALTGLYNFNGRSSRSALPVLRRLERLTHRAALEIELVYPERDSLFDIVLPDPEQMPKLRIVQHATGNDGPVRIEEFALTRAAGCVWLG